MAGAADHIDGFSRLAVSGEESGKDVTERSQQSTTKEVYNEQPTTIPRLLALGLSQVVSYREAVRVGKVFLAFITICSNSMISLFGVHAPGNTLVVALRVFLVLIFDHSFKEAIAACLLLACVLA